MRKIVFRYGGYGAISICVLFLAAWFLGDGQSYAVQEFIGYAVMIVSLSFVFFGIKQFRDTENEGKISFKKALTLGVLISGIVALVFGILDVIYVEFLNPDFMDEYYARSVAQMRAKLPEAEFKIKLAALEAQKSTFSNPFFTFLIMGMTVFVIGFIISLLSSLILQRK